MLIAQGVWAKLKRLLFTFYCQKHSIHKIDLAISQKMIHFTAFFKNEQNEE